MKTKKHTHRWKVVPKNAYACSAENGSCLQNAVVECECMESRCSEHDPRRRIKKR